MRLVPAAAEAAQVVPPLLLALGVPVAFILVGAIGRKLIRKTGWERADFYFGPQLCLATFSADVLFVGEIANQPHATDGHPEATGLVLLAVVFCSYLFLLTLHQDWQAREDRPKTQMFWLMVFSNLVGIGLFAIFVYLVKGIR